MYIVNSLRLSWNLAHRTGTAELQFTPPLPGGRSVVPVAGLSAAEVAMFAAMAELPGKLHYNPGDGLIYSEVVST